MEIDRSAVIKIGGTQYELILTTRATKEIARRYGGLEIWARSCSIPKTLKWPWMRYMADHTAGKPVDPYPQSQEQG